MTDEWCPIPTDLGVAHLSRDDLRLLALLGSGLSNAAAARAMHTSLRTLQRRTRDICDRLGVGTAVEAVVWAARCGLI